MHKAILGMLAFLFLACEEDFDHDDHAGLYVEVLAAQPISSNLGRLVRVFSTGGKSIRVSIEGGSIYSRPDCSVGSTEDACTCFGATSELALSVRPVNSEALLTISLHKEDGCKASDVLSQKQIAVARPAENTMDAGVADAPVTTLRGEGI